MKEQNGSDGEISPEPSISNLLDGGWNLIFLSIDDPKRGSIFSLLLSQSTSGAWWSASLRDSEYSIPGDDPLKLGDVRMLWMGLLHCCRRSLRNLFISCDVPSPA